MNICLFEINNEVIRLGFNHDIQPRFTLNIFKTFPYIYNINWNNQNKFNKQLIYQLLSTLIYDYLQIKPKEYNLLIIENVTSNKLMRQLIFESCLIDFQFQAISIQPSIFFPVISTQYNEGIIIEITDKETNAIAFYDKRPLLSTLKFSNVGINQIYDYFYYSLIKYNNTITDKEISKYLFDSIASLDVDYDLINENNSKHIIIQPLQGITNEDINLPKCLIDNSFELLIHGYDRYNGQVDDIGGIVGALLQCVLSSGIDIRSSICNNIIITGKGSTIPGLSNVIINELRQVISTSDSYDSLKPLLHKSQFKSVDRTFSNELLTWVGGSLFSSVKSNLLKFVKLSDVIKAGSNDIHVPDWLSIIENDRKIYEMNI